MLNIPNLLGFARLLSAPLAAYLIWHNMLSEAFWVFLIAGLTDAIDGPLARYLGTTGKFGLYLDPIADKTLINTIYVLLGLKLILPVWLVGLVFLRDFLIAITIGISKLFKYDLFVSPSRLSKANTGLQIALAAIALGAGAFDLPLKMVIDSLGYLIGATTVVSGGFYVFRGLQLAAEARASK